LKLAVKTFVLVANLDFGGAHESTSVPSWSGCTLQVLAASVKTTATVGYPLPSLTQKKATAQKYKLFVLFITFCYNLLEIIY